MQRLACSLPLCLLFLALCFGGCARKQFVPPDQRPAVVKSTQGQEIVKTARTQIGVRYTMGGTSPRSGFDCSGLVWWVYSRHGIQLPRTTEEQSRYGKAVKKGALQPGDVVIFRPKKRGGLHNGIYAGNGFFIHSPSSGSEVRMESMEKEYWQRAYKGARRFL